MATNQQKWVYWFTKNHSDGNAKMRETLGGKGANLAEMCRIGLPVPPGFTLPTHLCTYYYKHNKTYPDHLKKTVEEAIDKLNKITKRNFADPKNPLLISIRSGSRASMPGMMDTVLNLGLNDQTIKGLAQKTGDERFALDSYRRFIQMYANVVMGVMHDGFEQTLEDIKRSANLKNDTDLNVDHLKELIASYKHLLRTQTGNEFPQDPYQQLWGAISAVFDSWMSSRAIIYRQLHNIPENWGTAVNIQAMVFGNMGQDCATGVTFTRNPSNGENIFYGEYLINAQGEDVVAGIRTPQPLSSENMNDQNSNLIPMDQAMPKMFEKLCQIRQTLEHHYRDMQDIEFTVEKNQLYLLQTRNAKRTTAAAIKIATDMVDEGLISQKEALLRIDPANLEHILHPLLDPNSKYKILTSGLPASPGAVSGQITFTPDRASEMANAGMDVLLIRNETSPEDIHGMHAARGIITTRGGMTSHAAVVARGMARPCITSAINILINEEDKTAYIGHSKFSEGDWVSIDGTRGEVIEGAIKTVEPQLGDDFLKIMQWSDTYRKLAIRTNADTDADTKTALKFGAEGIGLCRTEHMFFDNARISIIRQMILSKNETQRRDALEKILPMQQHDFEEILTALEGKPVTIRLLDPPLHEFLPREERDFVNIARHSNIDVEKIKQHAQQLQESNPMLGHRGCRLLNSYPEIWEMQARAIFLAAINVFERHHIKSKIEIMIPLVALPLELKKLSDIIKKIEKELHEKTGVNIDYQIGTMIELPRAALLAGEIAEYAEFFSFGTNDLTQTTFGISRDDSANFLKEYQRLGIIDHDPFAYIDQTGVGELIKIAIERGRKARPQIKLGICGEHSGEPNSIEFCHHCDLDYVSCSPYRVPIARLAAAQAAIKADM
ncbi:MAG: pyruvate, phosphate dikinase [Pseudomonadota bacterium]